jgi:hypothetical protein
MEMRDMSAQLKSLKIDISKSFFVHFILNSPPLNILLLRSLITHIRINGR